MTRAEQKKALYWAIADAVANEATKQGFFMCMGHTGKWMHELDEFVDHILDIECHGKWGADE